MLKFEKNFQFSPRTTFCALIVGVVHHCGYNFLPETEKDNPHENSIVDGPNMILWDQKCKKKKFEFFKIYWFLGPFWGQNAPQMTHIEKKRQIYLKKSKKIKQKKGLPKKLTDRDEKHVFF